jgi:acyl carrier protein
VDVASLVTKYLVTTTPIRHNERVALRVESTGSTLDEVKSLICETLGIADRLDSMDASTGLLGSLPELDSMAVAELLAAIEQRFGLEVDSADITADIFDTVGTLAAYVEANRP